MEMNEKAFSEEVVAQKPGWSPIWILGGMGAIFIGMMVFEIFFKVKP